MKKVLIMTILVSVMVGLMAFNASPSWA